MLSIVLFLIIVTLLFLGNDKRDVPIPVSVPIVHPYSHHDCLIRESQRLTAYADFIIQGGEILDI